MKNRMLIQNLKNHIEETVTVKGFVETIRDQKKMQFLVLRDHTGKVQLIHMKNQTNEDLISFTISSLTLESTAIIVGKVVEAPQVKLGGLEIQIESIEVNSVAESSLPITPDSTLDKQIDWRPISLRYPKNLLIFQAQTTIEYAMRDYWAKNGFIEIHSPKLMGTASESGGELFKVPYFNNWTAYLAQSPQFYKQMAMAAGFDRVFEIGPVFRANPSFTSRHDTEFTSIDMEISWIDSHEDIMHIEEEWLQFILQDVQEKCGTKIRELYDREVVVPKVPFPRITMQKAYEILEEIGYTIPQEQKGDLNPEGERLLCDYIHKEFNHEFIFVTDYPATVRPFYHMRYNNAPDITKSFDLLWNGLEITTGAQREHRYEILVNQIKEKGLSIEPLQHYLNFFRYGCPPHGGLGFGLTRMLMILFGLQNVREATYLYRGPNRLTP